MVVVMLIATVASVIDQHIIALYSTDKELLTMCKLVLPVFLAACVFEAVEILGAGALTGMSAIATWLINLPAAYIDGITMGFGYPALWVGVLSRVLFKVRSYSLTLSHVRWGDIAERIKEAVVSAPDMEQSRAQFVVAAADIQHTKPSMMVSALERHRRQRFGRIRSLSGLNQFLPVAFVQMSILTPHLGNIALGPRRCLNRPVAQALHVHFEFVTQVDDQTQERHRVGDALNQTIGIEMEAISHGIISEFNILFSGGVLFWNPAGSRYGPYLDLGYDVFQSKDADSGFRRVVGVAT
ncbi:hypothetical protein PRIC2_014972 [Phytophthora ramorum]